KAGWKVPSYGTPLGKARKPRNQSRRARAKTSIAGPSSQVAMTMRSKSRCRQRRRRRSLRLAKGRGWDRLARILLLATERGSENQTGHPLIELTPGQELGQGLRRRP